MNTVKDILEEKGKQVWSVEPKTSLIDVLKKLRSHNVGALLVVEDGEVMGVISERDFAYRIAEKNTCPLEESVSTWMTSKVIAVSSGTTINECMQLMSREHIRHLPVVDDGKLVGLISIGDVVRAVISGQKSTILGLENYILSQRLTN
ncbi:MAG: CBS domain-containing protein [Anaerolineaceae bacterium]|jgi:CBS domain-containing protein|nr:CBS domain-containing protein [Anaerolineaceae bacterium]